MKEKSNSHFYNLKGFFQALFKVVHLNISVIVPSLTAVISAVATVVTSISGEDFTILLAITIASSSITVIGFVISIIKGVIRQKQIIIHSYTSKELDLFYDKIVSDSGYELIKKGKSRLMYSPKENDYVKKNILIIPFSFKGNVRYSVPSNLSRFAYRLFSDHLKSHKHFFDSRKIRMDVGIDELMKEEEPVFQLSKTTYFNSICSNEASKIELRYDDDIAYCFDGYTLVRTKTDKNKISRIYPLSESQCSNHIGVTTLAVTKDGYAILAKQGDSNLIGSNKLIATSSGSIDLKDRKKCKTLGDIVIKAMNRETVEECNINYFHIIDTKIIGYGRLLDRGGKPEFFGLTTLDISADEFIKLAEKGKETRKQYVKDFIKVEYNLSSIREKVTEIENNENKITIQLSYYLEELLPQIFKT